MDLALDHVFWLTSALEATASRLQAVGLAAKWGREHPSLASENRLMLFDEHYFEMLTVHGVPAVDLGWAARMEGPHMRLGWILRGPPPNPIGWTPLVLPDFPQSCLWVWQASLQHLDWPFVGCLSLQNGEPYPCPRDQGFPRAFFAHASGARAIDRVIVHGPRFGTDLAKALQAHHALPANFEVIDAGEPATTLHLLGAPQTLELKVDGMRFIGVG